MSRTRQPRPPPADAPRREAAAAADSRRDTGVGACTGPRRVLDGPAQAVVVRRRRASVRRRRHVGAAEVVAIRWEGGDERSDLGLVRRRRRTAGGGRAAAVVPGPRRCCARRGVLTLPSPKPASACRVSSPPMGNTRREAVMKSRPPHPSATSGTFAGSCAGRRARPVVARWNTVYPRRADSSARCTCVGRHR